MGCFLDSFYKPIDFSGLKYFLSTELFLELLTPNFLVVVYFDNLVYTWVTFEIRCVALCSLVTAPPITPRASWTLLLLSTPFDRMWNSGKSSIFDVVKVDTTAHYIWDEVPSVEVSEVNTSHFLIYDALKVLH